MKFNSLLCFTKNNNMNIENDKYTFEFEGIRFPKKARGNNGDFKSVERYIINELGECSYGRKYQLNHRSNQEKVIDFLIDIDYFKHYIIKEFPVIRRDSGGLYYLLDYYIPTKGIAIELDSGFHDQIKDKIRDKYLNSLGIKVLRIYDVFNHLSENIKKIYDFIELSELRSIIFDYSDIIEDYKNYLYEKSLPPSPPTIEERLKMTDEELVNVIVQNKWRKDILILSNMYDNNIIDSIRKDKEYSLSINLKELLKITPRKNKQVREYHPLINYLKKIKINLKVTSERIK